MNPDFNLTSTYTAKFHITRLIDKELSSSKCKLELVLNINTDDEEVDHTIMLRAQRFWLDKFVDQSIAYNAYATEAPLDLLNWVDNNILMFPDDPTDWLLLVVLCAKLNAIGQGQVSIAGARLTSSTSHGFGNAFAGNPISLLPTNLDWVGSPSLMTEPWWNRSDGGTLDIRLTGNETTMPTINLIDIHSQFKTQINQESIIESTEIIRPNFKTINIKND